MADSSVASLILFYALIAIIAGIYSLLGQGGGSGYMAVMAFFGSPPSYMKPAALIMNIFVTSAVVYRLGKLGRIDWNVCKPFLILSVPAAFLGGFTVLQDKSYQVLVGVLLMMAAVRLVMRMQLDYVARRPALASSLLAGGIAGYLGGLSGIGGGILLSPFLILMRWCTLQENIALSAVFVLVNSAAALLGLLFTPQELALDVLWMVVAAVIGSIIGGTWVSKAVEPRTLYYVLGVVLTIAGLKLILTV